jgi:hypothetical protein
LVIGEGFDKVGELNDEEVYENVDEEMRRLMMKEVDEVVRLTRLVR